MANVTIPNLTSATSITPESDLLVIEQTAGTRKATVNQILSEATTVLDCTEAQYEALTQEEKMDGKIRVVGDSQGRNSAAVTAYDNTDSGLSATNVQSAIDELDEDIDTINAHLTGLIQCTPFGLVGVSTPAGGIQDYTIPINVPNGYRFVGVLDATISGGQSVTLVSANVADATNAIVRTRNNGTTAVTPTGISIRALLVRTIATV